MLMKGEGKKIRPQAPAGGGEMDVWLYLRAVETYF